MMRRYLKFVRYIERHHISLVAAAGLLAVGVFIIWAASLKLPDPTTFEDRIVHQSTKIYDRTGEVLLFDVHENIRRTVVPGNEISKNVKNATVAIEDDTFFEHNGIRPLRTLKAIIDNILGGDLLGGQGGSTITQQVVKNSLLTQEKLLSRKFKEWILAVKLENMISKDSILEIYLNESPYGGSIYGIEEAAQTFFDTSARELTVAEAAYLAALPQAPTYYSPYGEHRDALENRKNLVLRRMHEEQFISDEEYESAKQEIVVFEDRELVNIRAPHFVFFIVDYLREKYGDRAVDEQGLRVISTLDYDLQKTAEEIAQRHALQNEETFNAENAALVAVDPKTGQILTMVGSRDYFDESIDGKFNVALAHRQPGSAFKPFVYAAAFEKGYTPDTVVFDLQTEFSTECHPDGTKRYGSAVCYMPQNYDTVFRGPMTLRNALAQSVNIPAVKVLYLVGLDAALRMAHNLGIEGLGNKDQYGLTLVLGGGEVTPLEMASAYSVFANDGVRNPPTGILRVENGNGDVLEEFEENDVRVLDADIARQISDVLSDNVARAPAFGDSSYLHFASRDVGVKTGTTNDYRDAWIVGYTPSISIAAWAGNNDNTSMEKRVAGFIVAPMWNEFMQAALQKVPEEVFPPAPPTPSDIPPILRGIWQGNEIVLVDRISGNRATESTPLETIEERVYPNVHSILYWIDRSDPLGPPPTDPTDDAQFEHWEYAVSRWAAANAGMIASLPITNVPDDNDVDTIHNQSNAPRVDIRGVSNDPYLEDDILTFSLDIRSTKSIQTIEIYVNDRYMSGGTVGSYTYAINLEDVPVLKENNTLRVVVTDIVFNRGAEEVSFSIDD